MGIWSSPIAVRPANLTIDQSKFSSAVIDRLGCHYLFSDETSSLDDFFLQMCDTARVIGYMDTELIGAWTEFAKEVARQNSLTRPLQFHMWCSDYEIPYFIQLDPADGKMSLHAGKLNDPSYTVVDTSLNPDLESPYTFYQESYMRMIDEAHPIFVSDLMRKKRLGQVFQI